MKQIKKMMALVIAMVMTLALALPAMAAASITITRDSSYSGTGDGNTYKYYKVFSASYESNTSTGGGSTAGAPGDVTGDAEAVSYTANSTVAGILGSWVEATYYVEGDEIPDGKAVGDVKEAAHWDRTAASGEDTGNLWFDLTPIAGTTNYNVSWVGEETAERVQAAAAWLIKHNAYEAGPTALTYTEGTGWTSGDIAAGYYLVEGATGKNLVAATTDVTIAEKNVYPPQDKTQADEDNTTKNNDTRDVAIGDALSYDVKVTIPATAAVGDKILVYDKNSVGLTFNNDLSVTSNEGNATVGTDDYTGTGAVEGAAWQRLITVTESSRGKDVIFSFTMTVNDSALVDSDKKNESALKYGPGSGETPWPYESNPDEVEYKTYFGGIEKVDGDNTSTKLENVEFTLKKGDNYVAVKQPAGADYYIIDTSVTGTATAAQATVKTAADGTIKIRGLDEDKTYTLTETKNPHAGYNMLAEPVTLTLSEDTASKTTYTPVAEDADFEAGKKYYTYNDGNYVEATGIEAFEAGTTYYTAETTGTSSYDGTTAATWQDVANFKGALLPSTGGIGTTIFYALGAILVIGAGVLLVTRRRMNVE